MISLIITAWKEPQTIGKAVKALLSQAEELDGEYELLLVCPDRETYEAAARVARDYRKIPFIYLKDPQKGKPYALNMVFQKAKGNVWVLTDGDVWIAPNALRELLRPFDDSSVGGVTGRPVCRNSRTSKWGYWGHLFMDAAHDKRMKTLGKGGFYAMSGYLLALRKDTIKIPPGVLDDVYLSYFVWRKSGKIVYAQSAQVYVSQPSSWKDWRDQKVRSIAGYQKLSIDAGDIPSMRTFVGDLGYALFPLLYARSLRELWWSLLQYPLRLYIWILTALQVKKGARATDIWKRIESTK